MTETHRVTAIVPADDLDASQAFYSLLGFEMVSDYGDYRILQDGRGWHLHITHSAGWPSHPEKNPFRLYLYCDDAVDTVAETIRRKAYLTRDCAYRAFLEDFYYALCTHLEDRLLLGRRRVNKFATANSLRP